MKLKYTKTKKEVAQETWATSSPTRFDELIVA
jgi:hypothetical protein